MAYGWLTMAAMGVAVLSAVKPEQHNLMKLPSFPGVLEVRASLPGRMRLYIAHLSEKSDAVVQLKQQLEAIEAITSVSYNLRTETMLILYDETRVEAAVVEGAIIKLLGLEEQLHHAPTAKVNEGLKVLKAAADRSVMQMTKGMMDAKTLAGTALTVSALFKLKGAGLALPGAATLLWWASHLLGGNNSENL